MDRKDRKPELRDAWGLGFPAKEGFGFRVSGFLGFGVLGFWGFRV